jgi:hypothetical protein
MAAITDGIGKGEITTSEAGELAKLVESYDRALECGAFEERLRALEERQTRERPS